MLVELEFGNVGFWEGGKLQTPLKNHWSKVRTNNKLNSYMTPGANQTAGKAV